MARTITIEDRQYEDALDAMLEGLREWFDHAFRDLEELSGRPLEQPLSHDLHDKLRKIHAIVEALEALGWPPEKPERKGS
jgi:hypothetical protein